MILIYESCRSKEQKGKKLVKVSQNVRDEIWIAHANNFIFSVKEIRKHIKSSNHPNIKFSVIDNPKEKCFKTYVRDN